MKKKCPGQDINRKTPEEAVSALPCPGCGYSIEFFFDDTRRVCHRCGLKVKKSAEKLVRDFSCADWCNGAESCLGSDAYKELNEAKKKLKSS